MTVLLHGWPKDVLMNGCLFCGGPPMFVHGTARTRDCDRCGSIWDAEDWGLFLTTGIMRMAGVA